METSTTISFYGICRKHIQKVEYLFSLSIRLHMMDCVKDIGLVTGVVIGIIILIVTPFVNSAIESHSIRQKLVNDLSSISLGMSKNYIDGLFGQPIIESRYEEAVTWYSDYQTEEPFISAGYKLKNSVLLCLYCDNNLVALLVLLFLTNSTLYFKL